ncbi:MAG: zinc ribbon domain-containing protein [Spirochaetales bacterium]
MKENKRARFFCESCDTEVVGDAKFCPKCGRFFAAVRCPACELTGEHFLFESGCPACGYAMDGSPIDPTITPQQRRRNYKKQQAKNKTNTKGDRSSYHFHSSGKSDDHLPVWVYLICIVLLATVIKLAFDFLG